MPKTNIKIVVCMTVLASAILPTMTRADLLERRAGRLIRDSGRWCDHVADVRQLKGQSNANVAVFLVTCRGRQFAQYEVLIAPDGKVISIKNF